jgi:hypothetical protein
MKSINTIALFIKTSVALAFTLVLIQVGMAQTISVDGTSVLVSGQASFPFWLAAGQTLAAGPSVTSVSVIEYNVVSSPSGGNVLTLERVVKVTSIQSVPANKAWKVEAALLDGGLSSILPIAGGGTNSSTSLNNNRVMISSSGAIVENAALAANLPVYTNASGTLTTTSPVTGVQGYWTQSGTTLSNTSLATNVGIGTSSANAALEVSSTTQGFAMPRMTTVQRRAISSPIAGLQVYDTNLKGYYYHDGSKWDCVSLPAGTVNYFASNTVPNGYLACNGAAVSRTTYPELFAAIGTAFGAGDGSSTFNLPDLRGEFIRGVDNGRGADPSRGFGTFQNFDWKGFSMTNTGQNVGSGGYSHGPVSMGKSTTSFIGNMFTGGWSAPAAAIGTQWDTSEIRPRNVALLAVIKY